jgi:hypothetical protein
MASLQTFASMISIWIVWFVLILAYILLILRLYRILQVKGERHHTIKLTNQGNLPSIYHLSAASTEPHLEFKFYHQDVPLIVIPEPEKKADAADAEQHSQPSIKAVEEPKKKPDAPPPKAGANIGGAAETGKTFATKVGVVASFLGVLGSLLPGKMGHKLKGKSTVARDVQARTLKTTQAPTRIQRKTDSLKRESGRLGVKTPNSDVLHAGDPEQIAPQAGSPSQQLQVAAAQIEPQKIFTPVSAQTQEVESGATILLTLRIGSKKMRYPEGSYFYTINSQQVPSVPIRITPPPVSKRGIVYFKSIAAWRYGLPFIVCGTIVVVTILSVVYYLTIS